MASGQKYNDDVKERAYAFFDTNNNIGFISRKMGIPESTLRGWKKEYDARAEEDGELATLRAKYKAGFVRSAWRSIALSQALLERRLRRAVEDEALIDELLLLVDAAAKGENVASTLRQGLVSKVKALHCEDIGKLVSILGTLYDKQALANREETEIVGGNLTVERFEDL